VQHAHARILTPQNQKKNNMGIGFLDNLENAWDDNLSLESKAIPETDAMGREMFWKEEYPNLAVKLFSETCCSDCSCKNE
jgi:hypothetical protein